MDMNPLSLPRFRKKYNPKQHGICGRTSNGVLFPRRITPVAALIADGAYDQDHVNQPVAARHPQAAITVPPRTGAVASASDETAPTQRDRHLRMIA
jgi:hypothetical protein